MVREELIVVTVPKAQVMRDTRFTLNSLTRVIGAGVFSFFRRIALHERLFNLRFLLLLLVLMIRKTATAR